MTDNGGDADRRVAFVLGGGGVHGAAEVGQLWALADAGIIPDLIVGTSVGAINGAVAAAWPGREGVERLANVWAQQAGGGVWDTPLVQLKTLLRSRTHLQSGDGLRRLLSRHLPAEFESLAVPFQCVATSIERAESHWFVTGPLVRAVLASCATSGVFAPVEIDGQHFLDGGVVDTIPIGRAVALGATEIYVLHVGRIESPLTPPRNLLQVAMVAFELARRHRFVEESATLPGHVTAHLLPAAADQRRVSGLRQLRYSDTSGVRAGIARAHEATAAFLDAIR